MVIIVWKPAIAKMTSTSVMLLKDAFADKDMEVDILFEIDQWNLLFTATFINILQARIARKNYYRVTFKRKKKLDTAV